MKFFESTPIGRILNRFAKDLETIESQIPDAFQPFSRYALSAISTLIVIIITTPMFSIVLVPIFILYFFIQVFSKFILNII